VAGPQDGFVELPGRASGRPLRLHYRDWGGSGADLVLLHGLSSNARIWDLTAPALTERLRALALDQRGHGLSDKPNNGYTFAAVTGDLYAAIEALGLERPLIAGHSWGGNVALQFAADNPEAVRALVLVDGGFIELSSFEGMTWEKARSILAPPQIDGMELDAFLAAARSWPGLDRVWSESVQELLLSNFEITPERTIKRYLSVANHMRILRSMWQQKTSRLWEKVRCPVLMIAAASELPDPRNQMWLKAKAQSIELATRTLKDARALWMEDTIHDIPLQRPQELAAAIVKFAQSL
jgi:pimeloyl-ACP methyl ester carboxylesterase